ncbi:MAG: response regulator [Deltaproteobacteria bacterium]|nr:response regulator [Deltaproteobacteria bacterium]
MRERFAALAEPAGLLQEIFASAPVALQICARDGRCVLVNPAHTALFGGVPPADFNIFEDSILIERGVADLMRRAFAGERIAIPTIWYDIRDLRNVEVDASAGRRIAVGAELVPLRDAAGEVSHVLFVFHDHTAAQLAREHAEATAIAAERRATQATFLADASRLLATTLEFELTLSQVARLATSSFADFCIIDLVNEDDSIRRVAVAHADPASLPILEELRERFPAHRGSPQPGARVIASGRAELLTEVDLAVVAQHTKSPDHRELVLRLGVRSHLAVPLQLGHRTLGAISLGYVGERRYTTSDIPVVEALASRAAVAIENARLYRVAEAARAEAEAANRAKDEFLAMLGHELRNPLAPIVTALELTRAREGASRERIVIERQVDHLRRLVDDLLDVSRITCGALELDRRRLELAEVVHDGIELAQPLIDQRQHRIEVHLPHGLTVYGDRVRLAQVVSNLLTNAARYTEPGGLITVTSERRGRELVLRVRDTGVGMPPELLAQVFDTFSRGRRSIDRTAGGLGLGLSIVKSLVELHGGHVRAYSDGAGRGSELEVVLPALDASLPAPQAPIPDQAPVERAELRVVLVVDDNEDAAELLAEALTGHGYEALVAHDPIAALEFLGERTPHVALVDLGLPGMDGYELVRRIRARPECTELPIVAITGYGQRSDRESTRAAGFAEHLVKPIRIHVLLPLLDTLLARS